jgi:hypothetical protein
MMPTGKKYKMEKIDINDLRSKFKSIIRKINVKSPLSSSYQIEAWPMGSGRTHMDIEDIEEGDPDLEED